jgi:nucleoside phosphorylase
LVIGICGGVPNGNNSEVFLGDTIISDVIVEYDFGRQLLDRFVQKDTLLDS